MIRMPLAAEPPKLVPSGCRSPTESQNSLWPTLQLHITLVTYLYTVSFPFLLCLQLLPARLASSKYPTKFLSRIRLVRIYTKTAPYDRTGLSWAPTTFFRILKDRINKTFILYYSCRTVLFRFLAHKSLFWDVVIYVDLSCALPCSSTLVDRCMRRLDQWLHKQ